MAMKLFYQYLKQVDGNKHNNTQSNTQIMNHLHLIKVKFLGATNTKGERVKITSTRHNKSKIIPYDYQFDCALHQALTYLNDLKYTIKATCELPQGYGVLVKEFTEFTPDAKVFDDKGKRLY